MFKRHAQFLASMRVIVDVLFIEAAFALAYGIRFYSPQLFPYVSVSPWGETVALGALAGVLYPLAFHLVGDLYRAQRSRAVGSEVFAVFRATLVATLVLVAATYFLREERYSRGVIILFAVLSFALVAAGRVGVRVLLHAARRRGYNQRYVLVVGAGRLARQVVGMIDRHREMGLRVSGALSLTRERVGSKVGSADVIATVRDLERVLDEREIDEVVIALPADKQRQLRRIMNVVSRTTANVKIVPDVVQYVTLSGGLEEFGGMPVISLQHGPLQGWNLVLKRAFDLCVAAVLLVVAAPLMALVAALVKLSSPGPVFYRQERMGMDGRVFGMYKFRTMREDAEAAGATFAAPDDPRRTRAGRLLRKLSIDELPQFFNVLRGDMSLVGPRPERPVFIEEFRRRIPRYHLRHKVKAGITGWAQVNGLRGQTSIEERLRYDLYYIENWSLLFDLKILARTVAGGFISRNAY